VFCALACGLVAQTARRTVCHDGSARGERKVGYGNNWVIAAIVVRLACLDRPVALPVGFALIRKGSDEASRLEAARRLVTALATALEGRALHVVADSAYAGKALRALPPAVTWTTRCAPTPLSTSPPRPAPAAGAAPAPKAPSSPPWPSSPPTPPSLPPR